MAKRPDGLKPCPIKCPCICHDAGHTSQHADTGVCPTKLGLPVPPLDLEHNA